jgi:glutaconate CoA-transferase subunit A
MSHDDVVSHISDGMTLGIGGWGSRRKPMSLVRAICNSDIKDLTVVSWGGPDLGLLCAYGKVKKAVFAFASLDSIPLEPHFRVARQNGAIETMEIGEGMFKLSLMAAAQRMPFLPTRAGLGTDVMSINPDFKTVQSPYDDGESFVAMPPLRCDVSLIHMNRADAKGAGMFLGPDLYFDDMFAMASDKCFMSAEKVVPTEDLLSEGDITRLRINRLFIDGVVEAPRGAHFTQCPPDYDRDEAFQTAYAKTAKDPELWEAFKSRYIDGVDLEGYLNAVDTRTDGGTV